LQQYVARTLVALFPGQLEPDDVRSTSMGAAGDDVLLSPLAQRLIPFDIECKNVENLSIWAALRQATSRRGVRMPMVVAKRNRRPAVAVVPFGWLARIVGGVAEPECSVASLRCATLEEAVAGVTGCSGEVWRGLRVTCHSKKRMKFWPAVDGAGDILIFNGGDAAATIYAVISWALFQHAIVANDAVPGIPQASAPAAAAADGSPRLVGRDGAVHDCELPGV